MFRHLKLGLAGPGSRFAICAVCIGIFLLLRIFNPLPAERFRDSSIGKLIDVVTELRGAGDSRSRAQVVIVDIDEATIAKYGRWPVPRRDLAELLDALKTVTQVVGKVGVRDVVFPEVTVVAFAQDVMKLNEVAQFLLVRFQQFVVVVNVLLVVAPGDEVVVKRPEAVSDKFPFRGLVDQQAAKAGAVEKETPGGSFSLRGFSYVQNL